MDARSKLGAILGEEETARVTGDGVNVPMLMHARCAEALRTALEIGMPPLMHQRAETLLGEIAAVPGGCERIQARSISHWSPYDRVRVLNADP